MEVADSVAARRILGAEDAETSRPSGARERMCVREPRNTQVHTTTDELFPDHISVMSSSDWHAHTHAHTRHGTLSELRRHKQQLHRNNLLLLLLLLSLPPRLLRVAAGHKFVFTQCLNRGKTLRHSNIQINPQANCVAFYLFFSLCVCVCACAL